MIILIAACGFGRSTRLGELRLGNVGRNGVPASMHASTNISSVIGPLLATLSRLVINLERLVLVVDNSY